MTNEKDFIPVNKPWIIDEDIAEVTRVLREGWVSGDAPEVEAFESEFSSRHGCIHGIAVPNGTIAIDLLLSVLSIGPGDEVILPSFTIISCLSQILRLGATPVFVDADLQTWNMDVSAVEMSITERTKLILAVHTYGLPVDVAPLAELSSRTGIPLVEDCAEAHGLLYRGTSCGQFGLASTFSFYANKNVTTGEGGMICTSDAELAEKLRFFRNLTFDPANRFVHESIGWNFRFTAIQAALGRAQLRRLDTVIARRRATAEIYMEALSGLPGVSFAPRQTDYGKNDFWVVGITLEPGQWGGSKGVRESLEASGVGTRPFFFPLHLQPVFAKSMVFRQFTLPNSEYLYSQGLYLPNGLGSSITELEDCAVRVRDTLLASIS